MQEIKKIKKCVRCGTTIAHMDDCDWFRYIRVKYCDNCKIEAEKERYTRYNRKRKRRLGEQEKAIEQLERENERLRTMLQELERGKK